ncbi:MAG: sulfotransferase family protein [Acidimicrobiales bacterium]
MTAPAFFVVGAPKCGTSSLTAYLSQHSDVYLPDRKDVPYFGSDLDHRLGDGPETLQTYLGRFAAARPGQLAGEASVWYLYSTRAAAEIAAFEPRARVVAMFRDPVEVLYSLHSHLLFMGDEDIVAFEEALATEDDRRAGGRLPPATRFAAGLLYRRVVRFAEQLERYLDVLGPDRVHVVVFDDLQQDPGAVARRVFEFLGLAPETPGDLRVVNANKVPRSRMAHAFFQRPPAGLEAAFRAVAPRALHGRVLPFFNRLNIAQRPRSPMAPELAARLRLELAPEVARLGALIGRDLSHWSR